MTGWALGVPLHRAVRESCRIPRGFLPTILAFSGWQETGHQHCVLSCYRCLGGDNFFQPFPAICHLGMSFFPLLKTHVIIYCDTEMCDQLMSGCMSKALLQ